MAIAFESFTFLGQFLNHGNIVLSKPAGTVAGDLLLFLAQDDRPTAGRSFGTLPAGWTLIDEFNHQGPQAAIAAMAFKIAGPSEPASYTFQVLPSQNSATITAIIRFSSTNGFPVNPIDAFARASLRSFVNSPFDTTIPSTTVVASEAQILRVLMCRNAPQPYGDGLFSYQSGPAATEIMDKGTSDISNRAGFGVYLQDAKVGSGATGTSVIRFSHSQTIATNYDRWMWTLALIELPPPDLSVPKIESVSSFTDSVLPLLPIPKPAGLAVGELMLGIVSNRIEGSAVTTVPAGWTKVTQVTPPFGVPDTTLAFKIADAADVIATDFIFTHSVAGGFAFVGAILRISGINPATPINVFLFNDTFPGPSIAAPDVVTTVNGCLLIRVDVSQSNSSGAHTASTPVGHTERVEISVAAQPGTGSHRLGMSVQTKDVNQPLAGSTGTELITVAGLGTNPSLVGLTIAIAPALPPVFQSAGQANDTGGGSGVGSLNVPHPSGLLVGDLMLAFMHLRQNPDRIYNTPSGWTNEGSSHDAGSNGRITIFSKTADSADVAAGSTTFICSQSDCFRLIGIILRLTEHNPLAPVDVVGFTIQAVASGSPASWVCPSVVTTVINAKILRADVITQDVVSGITAALASAIQRKVRQNATNSEIRIFEENAVQVAPGATGTATILITGGAGTHKGHGVTVALAPVITVPPGAGPAGGFKGPFRLLGRRWRVLGTGA